MIEQESKSVETGVDRLVHFLKDKGKVELKEVAISLNVPESVLQRWVDFLVEEKIIGLEYNFTKPLVYLIQKTETTDEDRAISRKDFLDYKKGFKERAQKSSVPVDKTDYVWRNHILQRLELMKKLFYMEAGKRGLKNIDNLWLEYKKRATEM